MNNAAVRVLAMWGALACAATPRAAEIATGVMLGPGHEPRSFYVRQPGGKWVKTYSGQRYRTEAAGRLMNLRIAQAITHDEWLTEFPFDAEANTKRLIEALDTYRDHEILAISVSLQGGNAGYAKEFPQISRSIEYKDGPGKGAWYSGFNADGTLKERWLKRLLPLLRELDKRGMIAEVLYFYQGQDEVFQDTAAIRRAVVNATDWLIDNNCRNVIIEIANEHNVRSYDHGRYIHNETGSLVQLAKSRFQAKKAPFRLPVSSSAAGMQVFEGVRQYGDLSIVHGNNRKPEEKRKRIAELVVDPGVPGPVYMNEDNNGRETTEENLVNELASCDAVFQSGGSWGYMPWMQVQRFPFRYYKPSAGVKVTNGMKVEERDQAYFHVVLDHIRKTVLAGGAPRCKLSGR
jgi:hypothetical protein